MRVGPGCLSLCLWVWGASPACAGPPPGVRRVEEPDSSSPAPRPRPRPVLTGATVYGKALPPRFRLPETLESRSAKATLQVAPHVSPSWPPVGTLVVGGVSTGMRWKGKPPRVYALDPGRYVLYDGHDTSRAFLWEPAGRRLTVLGRVSLLGVPSLGRSVLLCNPSRKRAYRLCDVDVGRRRLRVIWSHPAVLGLGVIGQRRGALVVAHQKWTHATAARPRQPWVELHVLTPGRRAVRKRFRLGTFRIAGSPDAVRGDRVLLVGPTTPPMARLFSTINAPFHGPVALLDMATGKRRDLGQAAGGWTRCTGGIHPHLRAMWSDRRRPGTIDWCYPGTAYVDPKTERLLSLPRVLGSPRKYNAARRRRGRRPR